MQRKAWARDIYRIARTYAGTWLKEGELGVIDWRDWCERCRKGCGKGISTGLRGLMLWVWPKGGEGLPGRTCAGVCKGGDKKADGCIMKSEKISERHGHWDSLIQRALF